MPTYGYECTACTDKFETQQRIKDDPLTICEKCGGTLKKLIYPIGIAFKGSGFYVNDYAGKPAAPVSSTSGSEAATESKTETKSETKTESKSDTPSTSTPAPAPAAA